jgi:putative FmdB family regulatory protein
MPIYEYACTSCQKVFEELILRKSDETAVACPACKGGQVSRVMSRPAATRAGDGGGDRAAAPACGPVG